MKEQPVKDVVIKFKYETYNQHVSDREVRLQHERDGHFSGIDLTKNDHRTFKKERVMQYYEGTENLLESTKSYVPAPIRAPDSYRFFNRNPEGLLEVCFTGFKQVEKDELIAMARLNRCHVVMDVTSRLSFLVCGSNAGPKKIERALNHSGKVEIMPKEAFLHFIKTGEITV